MRTKIITFLMLAVFALFGANSVVAQVVVSGNVIDAETSEPLIGATIQMTGSQKTVFTDDNGHFTIKMAKKNGTLTVKYLGYKSYNQDIAVKGKKVDLGSILLEIDAMKLKDAVVTARAIARKTPVALSTIPSAYIEERIGTADFTKILQSTPSVYVSRDGGGYGDSKINIRGFKSENNAVLVNGVPMNDMEWGGVYWSNWAGLTDVASSVQSQRGLGASKVSTPSVGGSINIITKTTDAKKGGFFSYGMGNDGYNKMLFSISSGKMKGDWSFTVLGGKTWGDGYIQGTEFEGYNYFASLSKQFGSKHLLSFAAFGAPQWHNQRSRYDGLSIQGWQDVQKYMKPGEQYRYNPTYGFGKNGERKTSAHNMYHKPQLQLKHVWQIDNSSNLNTVLYMSIGKGGGYKGQGRGNYRNLWYGTSDGTLNMTFRNADGTFAYDQIQELNEQSEEGSQMVMSESKNEHKWYGLISTYTKNLKNNFNFYGGIDARYYIGTHTNEIIDLYNGDYYIDESRRSVKPENFAGAGTPAFNNQKLSVGDVVYRDYDGHVLQGGAFGQAEYDNGQLTAFVAGSVNETSQWRYDRFYYDKAHAKSDKVNKFGFTAKGGANFKITENHNVFANIGYISRAPFFSGGCFLSSTVSNQVNDDAVNEKIFSFELGYGFHSRMFSANVNAYHTKWFDKTMAKSVEDKKTGERGSINMTGVNSIHQGIEVDATFQPFSWMNLTGMFSIGNWRWVNNPTGYFYDSNGQPIKNGPNGWEVASGIHADDHAKMTLVQKGVKEGGSAQITGALGLNVFPMKGLRLSLDWNVFSNNYADYEIKSKDMSLNGNKVYDTPWKIPAYSLFDFSASYKFNIGKIGATVSGNIENIFDQEYINTAYDGGGHDWESAYRVFYGFGRQMSLRFKVNF